MTIFTFQVDLLATHYYSHKFVCVAPYSTDTLLLINIPKTMLEKVIKVTLNILISPIRTDAGIRWWKIGSEEKLTCVNIVLGSRRSIRA